MAEIDGAIGRQFQSLSIVFVFAVNTKLASLFELEFSLQIYIELTGAAMFQTCPNHVHVLNDHTQFLNSPYVFFEITNMRWLNMIQM
jgi:hypothetical protein